MPEYISIFTITEIMCMASIVVVGFVTDYVLHGMAAGFVFVIVKRQLVNDGTRVKYLSMLYRLLPISGKVTPASYKRVYRG